MKFARSKYSVLLPMMLFVIMSFTFSTKISSAQQFPASCGLFSQVEFQTEDNFTLTSSSFSPENFSQVKTTNYSDNNFSNESFLSINRVYLKEIKRSALKGAFRNIKI